MFGSLLKFVGAIVGISSLFCQVAVGRQRIAESPNPGQLIEDVFKQTRQNPLELHAFLEQMPKGADLHVHLAGAVYAESLIQDAVDDNLCVDKATMTLVSEASTVRSTSPLPACRGTTVAAANALVDQSFYRALVDAFSMRSFVPSSVVSGHDQFFETFGRFQRIDAKKHLGEWLDEVATRAASQNEQYLEIMHTPDFAHAARLGYEIGWSGNFAQTREALLARGLRQNVDADRKELDEGDAARRNIERCSDENRDKACAVEIRFLFQVLRGFPPEQVFAQALLGFELASVDPLVLGINFVMPEDWHVPMIEYHRQMEMLDYLHSVYPKIHISLHAGELSPGLVPPAGLRFHIREAVEIGHAERIGHGVDVMYERDPYGLLSEMAREHVLVEINLTSNDTILGIRGRDHPLPIYRASHVPVALSTDDEGVSRIDLTHEYERAVEDFDLDYDDLKDLARTGLEHSFLPGASLWQRPDAFHAPVTSCAGIAAGAVKQSPQCSAFLGANEKAKQEWELEKRFATFETTTIKGIVLYPTVKSRTHNASRKRPG